jgi:putative hydrolase of the HAD superfamily
VQAILFDFGGTLDADGVAWIDRFFPLYREARVAVPRSEFDRAFRAADDNLASRFALKGLSLEATLALQAECVLESLAPAMRDQGRPISAAFLEECRRHFSRNRPVLERLGRKFKLAVVSNFYGNLESVLESEGLSGLFDAVADSRLVGAEKPSPGIFLHALEELGVNAGDCLMVGDSIPRDMRGAEALNMRHALISPEPRVCCPGALKASSLPRLESLLS